MIPAGGRGEMQGRLEVKRRNMNWCMRLDHLQL
jgi:hypothetical protein